LHDGICDCCDGSDEEPNLPTGTGDPKTNPCPVDCDTVLKAERERQARIHNDFRIGSRKRETDLLGFSNLRTKKAAEAAEYDKLLAVVDSEIEHIKGTQIVGLKEAYVSSRVATMKDSVAEGPMAISLLSGLEDEELEAMMVHLCQVAGEITKSDGRHGDDIDDTCLALRVAALDLGLTWSDPEDYEGGTTEATFHENKTEEIVDIVFENASEALPPLRWKSWSSKGKKKSPTKGRRRLDEINDDYPIHDDDYDYTYHMDDDEFNEEDQHHRDSTAKRARESHQKESSAKEDSKAKGKEKELIDEIRTSLFSATRATFLKESQEILDEIGKILDVLSPEGANNDETNDKKKTNAGETSESDKPQANDKSEATKEGSDKATIDSTAYTMLRNKLRKKRDIVERGFRWGASAKILLGASPKESTRSKRKILERLVVGTIFYGQISALQAWQILQTVLPEYKVRSPRNNEAAETTCASPWAGNCPPKHVYREFPEGGGDDSAVPGFIEYPPSFLLEVAAAFCDEEASNFGKEGAITNLACQENDSNDNNNIRDVIESLASHSSSEAHRFFEYVVPNRRNQETDPFQTMFKPILNLPIDVQGLQSLEGDRIAKEKEQENLIKNIEAVWKDIGGRDGNALGRDGEIHSIANKCFEVVAGKYTYELCLSGKAQQKEGSSKSGTNLGHWEGIEYLKDGDDGSSTRVLKWENGVKCWNGPKRSATVYLKCGPDHKVLSADEPDTCRYVFQMETYLACDEAYKRRVGL
jgi:hypothetical protein